MKTSIIVSTFTLLYSLATFAGTPSHHNDVNKNETVCSNSFIPSHLLVVLNTENMVTGEKKENTLKTVVPIIEDFHYMKFEVASYEVDNEITDKDNVEIKFDYLKFIVPQGTEYNELTPDKTMELPVYGYEYLKFDVRGYSDNPDLNSM